MATTRIVIVDNSTTATATEKYKAHSTLPKEGLNKLGNMCSALAGGLAIGSVQVSVGSGTATTAASGTVLIAQVSVTAGDIVYVGSTGFVATNGAVVLGEATFDMRTSDTAAATSLKAQINARATLNTSVVATSVTGTVTVTALGRVPEANHITLAKVNTNNAAFVLNGLANTVLQSTLLNGAQGGDTSPVVYSAAY